MDKGQSNPRLIKYSIIILVVVLFVDFPVFIHSKIANNFMQSFAFQVSPQNKTLYAQLNSEIALVPSNASLMTEYFIIPHVLNRENLELTNPDWYAFKPDYILVDFNLNISLDSIDPTYIHFLYNLTKTYNYTFYSRNGTAWLLRAGT